MKVTNNEAILIMIVVGVFFLLMMLLVESQSAKTEEAIRLILENSMRYAIAVILAFSVAAGTLIWLQEYQKAKLLEIIEMPTKKPR